MTTQFSPLLDIVGGIAGVVAAIKQSAALVALLVVLAIAVLINAGDQLRAVRTGLAGSVSRALSLGVAVQLAWLPALLVLCIALTLTILGLLAVPFVIVGWLALTIGLVILGLAAVAEMIGQALSRRGPRGLTERGARLQAMVTGIVILAAPWFASALLTGVPFAAGAFRALGIGLLWVAITAGLGAVVRTRAGTLLPGEPWGFKRPSQSGQVAVVSAPSDWVTPTPITGVVAARRPTVGAER
ncbi:MAG: hypothetical protein MUF21_04860 [Gemmatimonadaceae bacterium]|jgi:hypothetical protein|nr:hypothetical protein [Gemmatimonadaceae bacterium]